MDTATIQANGEIKAQVQIVDTQKGRKAQLYAANGVFLCESAFTGDNDTGFAIGQALYNGYAAGCANTKFVIGKAVTAATYAQHDVIVEGGPILI